MVNLGGGGGLTEDSLDEGPEIGLGDDLFDESIVGLKLFDGDRFGGVINGSNSETISEAA